MTDAQELKGLIPSMKMLEQNKRDLENPKGPPLPSPSPPPPLRLGEPGYVEKNEEDYDNITEVNRRTVTPLQMLRADMIAFKAKAEQIIEAAKQGIVPTAP